MPVSGSRRENAASPRWVSAIWIIFIVDPYWIFKRYKRKGVGVKMIISKKDCWFPASTDSGESGTSQGHGDMGVNPDLLFTQTEVPGRSL
jgi:hypothetical protein